MRTTLLISKTCGFFTRQWLDPDCYSPGCIADIDNVNGVNMDDLALLTRNWQFEEPHLLINEFMASNASNKPPLPPKEGRTEMQIHSFRNRFSRFIGQRK